MRTRLAAVFAILFCSRLAPSQTAQNLFPDLVRHTLIVRHFYTDKKLRFDVNGAVIGSATAGDGPSDAQVYVEGVQLEPGKLIIRGERPIPVLDPATGDLTLLSIHQKIEIELQLPPGELVTRAGKALLERVFLTPAEMNAVDCSTEEDRSFREQMLRSKATVSVRPQGKKSGGKPQQLCFPGGSRAYVVADDIVPPKEVHSFDPAYPPSKRGSQENRVVDLGMIVDTSGKPTTLVVIGAGSASAFELAAINAIESWKYAPGTYQGKPVPTAMTVEVSFTAP